MSAQLPTTFFMMPRHAHTTMTTPELRELLMRHDGQIIANGVLWTICSKNLGAGVHRVYLEADDFKSKDPKDNTITELKSKCASLEAALEESQQQSHLVREYMDEARDWIKTILEEAEASPHTREEWRNGLCRGDIEAVMTKCKAALSELPEGGEVVFIVRQRLIESYMDVQDAARAATGDKTDGR